MSLPSPEELTPDYETGCDVCGAVPTLPALGLCAPCTFGEHDATFDDDPDTKATTQGEET